MPPHDQIIEAARLIRTGDLVAFATETVYGLGADASNASAVAKVFALKGRPAHHPLIVHLPDQSHIHQWTAKADRRLLELADAFWPGPLTLVCPKHASVLLAVTGGLDTVAVRVPNHPIASALLIEFGGGVAAPSANRYGRVSPTTADAVRDELGKDIFVLDGGPTTVGLESTIVTVESGELRLLRHGGISAENIVAVAGELIDDSHGTARASGMVKHHYAPTCRVRIYEADEDLPSPNENAAMMGLGSDLPLDLPTPHFSMNNIEEFATQLYSSLRMADSLEVEELIVVLPPPAGLGAAIRDRLLRAAAPKDESE